MSRALVTPLREYLNSFELVLWNEHWVVDFAWLPAERQIKFSCCQQRLSGQDFQLSLKTNESILLHTISASMGLCFLWRCFLLVKQKVLFIKYEFNASIKNKRCTCWLDNERVKIASGETVSSLGLSQKAHQPIWSFDQTGEILLSAVIRSSGLSSIQLE